MREAARPLLSKLPGHDRIFYGWWIVAAAFGVRVLQGALYSTAYGGYLVLLREEFGWSKTALSAAYSVAQTEAGVVGPFEGWLIDRFGPRAILRIGIVMFGVGFILLSQVNSFPMFFAVFLIVALGSSLGTFMGWSVALVNWFERRRTRALSLLSLGWATGALAAPLIIWSLQHFGWRTTAFASGVIILAIGLPLTQVVRHRPEDHGYTRDGLSADAAGPERRRTSTDFTAGEALRTSAFWLLGVGHAASLLVIIAVQVHLVSYLHEDLHYSLVGAGVIIAFGTGCQIVGQISGGLLGDRLSKRRIAFVAMLCHAGGALLLAYAHSLAMILAFSVLHYWAWGARPPLMQALRADYFGVSSYGTIMGLSSVLIMMGTVSGPLLAGILADETGSYRTGFTIMAVIAGVCSVLFLLARRPPPPLRLGASPLPDLTAGQSTPLLGTSRS